MKKIKILVLLFLLCFYSFAQELDTMVIDVNATFYGTKPLPESILNNLSMEKGYELVNIKCSECDNNIPENKKLLVRISEKRFLQDTLTITVCFIDDCGAGFLGEISVESNTLNLLYSRSGVTEYCNCIYYLTYFIKTKTEKEFTYKLNNKLISYSNEKYITYPIKYEIENGDTINYLDKHGLKQGLWKMKNDEGFFRTICEFKDGEMFSGKQRMTYYPSGKLKSVFIVKNGVIIRYYEYYENGSLKKDCNVAPETYIARNCKEWNIKGKLVK